MFASCIRRCSAGSGVMLRPVLVAGLSCLALGGAAAQPDGPHDPYTDLSDYLLSAPSPPAQVASVFQSGSGNRATITQSGDRNAAFEFQGGDGNVATIVINGRENAVGIAQAGSGNESSIGVGGDSNRVVNVQVGSNLSYSVQVIGNDRTVVVTQFGSK